MYITVIVMIVSVLDIAVVFRNQVLTLTLFLIQHAADLVKTVASRYDEYINVKDLSDKISRALTAAKKDNDFIYHDRIPDLKDLEPIGKASLVKATPVVVPLSQKFTGKQAFYCNLPFNIHYSQQ